ncbi:MAG: PorT family protein [Bacteroidales bacterium]|nr:PorT family protein [Bacteroidales bacterium]
MKKTAWILAAVFLLNGSASFSTSVAAQSNKPVFIDSPAYVLRNGGGQDIGTATKPQPASETETPLSTPATALNRTSGTTPRPTNPPATPTYEVATTSAPAVNAKPGRKPADRQKADKPRNPLARQGKLVYVSFDVAPVFNWYANIDRPFDRKGCRAIVNPTLSVDFDLGYYMFLGTGVSFNTTGGRLQFPSDYVNQYGQLGFSSYNQVLRSYTASYIEIPVVFRVQSHAMQGWRVFGSVAGHFGIRVLAKYRDTYDDFSFLAASGKTAPIIDGTLIREGKFNKGVNLWQVALGARFGASYQVADALALRFGIGYRYGFLDAFSKHHERPGGTYPHMKPQQFEIFAGITF